MWYRVHMLVLLGAMFAGAEVYDSIAVSIGAHAIQASEMDRDIRLTGFLNGTKLEFDTAAKRKAANRLIDQFLIREEMAKGQYPNATPAVTDEVLNGIQKARFRGDAEYRQALKNCGITEPELKAHIAWQIAVLRFIEIRFRPQPATDAKLQNAASVKAAEERINQAFFLWLDESRKHARIQFRGELSQ